MKRTLVLGASTHEYRYANIAIRRLLQHGHEVIPIGIEHGSIEGLEIIIRQPPLENVDTVTIYLNPFKQKEYYQYLISLKPKRIIFNPGAENPELVQLAQKNGIETEEACTLVLLSIHQY